MSAARTAPAPAPPPLPLGIEAWFAGLLRQVEEAAQRGAERALAAAQADVWLDARAAARLVYGRDDRLDAFAQLRRRRPELDRASSGDGKLRRWRRSDLERLLGEGLLGRRKATP